MKIVVAGGGSGGHLTPLIAVGAALKSINSEIKVIHIGQKGEGLQNVVEHPSIDESFSITTGKFRRYHGESFLQHVTDYKTMFLNFRDFFKFLTGVIQSWKLLGKVSPDAVFLKGGFVCVPVGYACKLRKIPYITHDSDSVPGLANRLTAKNAVFNTTAMKADLYPYERTKTIQVGIPIQPEYQLVTDKDKAEAKHGLDFPSDSKLVLSVGGGLGAQRLNHAVVDAAVELLDDSKVYIIHLTGKALHQETLKLYKEKLGNNYDSSQLRVIDFSTKLFELSAAADVIITRAGATNIAEFAMQAKPCVVVPNPVLTGGQQLHNADVLINGKAAVIVHEEDLPSLAGVVKSLLNDEKLARNYASSLHQFAVKDSAKRIAEILIEIIKRNPVVSGEISS